MNMGVRVRMGKVNATQVQLPTPMHQWCVLGVRGYVSVRLSTCVGIG